MHGGLLSADALERLADVAQFQEVLRDYLKHEESLAIAAHAQERLEQLRGRLSGTRGKHEDPRCVYDCFGESRFGFQQALRIWPGNEKARSGLQRTLVRNVMGPGVEALVPSGT